MNIDCEFVGLLLTFVIDALFECNSMDFKGSVSLLSLLYILAPLSYKLHARFFITVIDIIIVISELRLLYLLDF